MSWGKREYKAKQKEMGKGFFCGFIASLVMMYVLAMFIGLAGAVTAGAGALIGLWVWLGFLATTTLSGAIWEGKSFSLFVVNTGLQLVTAIISGAILAVWI